MELADKGMIKEARVIWQNRAEFCRYPLIEPYYIHLLVQAGQIQELVKLIREQ